MDLRQLKYFVCIVEAGSISRASLSLHVAQPALSKQLNQLEEELGAQLLARSVRGVTPTHAGLAVYRHAQAVLKQVAATSSIAAQASGSVVGTVSIGLPWTISSMLGVSLLREVHASLSAVRIEITEGPSSSLSQALSQGKLDLAVVFCAGPHAALRLTPLATESLRLVGAAGSLGKHAPYSLDAVAELPLLLMSRPNGIREQIEYLWASRGIQPNIVAEINAGELLIEAVKAGVGFGILPSCAIHRSRLAEAIDVMDLSDDAPRRTVYLATAMLFPISPATQRVYDILEGLLRRAVEDGRWEANLVD